MSRDKQIDEMVKLMCGNRKIFKSCKSCRTANPNANAYCRIENGAEILVSEGYRKASDVAREIMQDVRQTLLNMVLANSMGEIYDVEKRFSGIEKKYESEGAE